MEIHEGNKYKTKIILKAFINFKILSGSSLFLKTFEFFDVYSEQGHFHFWDPHAVICYYATQKELHTGTHMKPKGQSYRWEFVQGLI